MNKSVLFLLGILTVVLVSGCTQTGQVTNIDVDTGSDVVKECPASCDDGNECTADLCDGNSDFECRNIPRWGLECGENGICQDGVCVEMTDNCSHLVETEETEMCYFREYYIPARRGGGILVCDGITDNLFIGRCYAYVGLGGDDPVVCEGLDKQESRDECYAFYAKGKADIFIFAGDACKKIENVKMKADCMVLEEIVIAPVGIKDFDAWAVRDGSGNIYSYFVLKDTKGRTTTAEGDVTVIILQEKDDEGMRKLFSKKYYVTEEDYEIYGRLGEADLTFLIPTISADDFEYQPNANKGTLYMTFATKDGKYFHEQKEIF